MEDDILSLNWNNHKDTVFNIFSKLREKERYTDATLACQGKFYPVHKLILSACSEYFENIFENTSCKHPVIVLQDIDQGVLEALLNYMYIGFVHVAQNDLLKIVKTAELLQIKGLAIADDTLPASDSATKYTTSNSSRCYKEDRKSAPLKRKNQEENNESIPNSSSSSHLAHFKDSEYFNSAFKRKSEILPSRPFTPESSQSDIKVVLDESLVKKESEEIFVEDLVENNESECYAPDENESVLDINTNNKGLELYDHHSSLVVQPRSQLEYMTGSSTMQGLCPEVLNINDILPQPLCELNQLEDLCLRLEKDNELRQQMVMALGSLGGTSFREGIRTMMNRIATNSLWELFSLKGQKGKFPLNELFIYRVLSESCFFCFQLDNQSVVDQEISLKLKYVSYTKGGSKQRVSTMK